MSVIIHPEYKKLKDRLSNLIMEYDVLKYEVCPQIEMKYLLNFGFLEFELYKKDVTLSKLKRKLQLIQIQINNEAEIDMAEIDRKLEKEFEEYEKNIQKQMDELDEAINASKGDFLTAEENKKLKMIYKQCVKKLHPDLNPDQSEFEKKLFLQVNQAFQDGNLEALESMYYLIPKEVEHISEIDRLGDLIKEWEKKIRELKENYPYNKKEFISSNRRMMEYKMELNGLIKQFDSEISIYQEKILKLI